jgi:hypothetical protein
VACRETGARPEDPEGGVPRHWAAACGSARSALRRRRRLGGGTPRAPRGRWSASCGARVRGEILQGAQALAVFTKRKAGKSGTSGPTSRERTVDTQFVFGRNAMFRTESRPAAREGSDRAVESGRSPTGGPVRSDRERTLFFPRHSVLRTSFHYGKIRLDPLKSGGP